MDQNSKQYESIARKIRSLHRLAEQGAAGEAENARRLIDALLSKYGLSLDSVLNADEKKWYRFRIGQGKEMLFLFTQCYAAATGNRRGMVYKKITRAEIAVELNAYQCAEITAMFSWHSENYKREMADMTKAFNEGYCIKHNLFAAAAADDDARNAPLSQEDLERLQKAYAMKAQMSNRVYRKMLDGANNIECTSGGVPSGRRLGADSAMCDYYSE